MTKEEIFLTLMSLTVGQYEMQGKSVLVEPITILGMRRGKRITIRENYQSLSFTLLFNRRSYYTIEDMVSVNLEDEDKFLTSIFPPKPTLEEGLKRETNEVLVLIFALITIVTTPVTMVGFIMDQSWAWGTLFFLLAMIWNIIWLWRKLK